MTSIVQTKTQAPSIQEHRTTVKSLVVRDHVKEYLNRRWEVIYGYMAFTGVIAFLIAPFAMTAFIVLYFGCLYGVMWVAAVLTMNCLESKYHPRGLVGRRWAPFHNFIGSLYQIFAKAMPIKIVKLGDEGEYAMPGRRLLFCYHPHGVVFLGPCELQFNFEKYFPGKQCWCMMSNMCFVAPLFRHFCFWVGGIPVTKVAAKEAIKTENVCLSLIPGGVAEMIHADPTPRRLDSWEIQNAKIYPNVTSQLNNEDETRTMTWDEEKKTVVLYLLRRKGFIRMAMELGLDLVPVFTFGEIDLFKQPRLGMGWRMKASHLLRMPCTFVFGRVLCFPYEASVNVLVGSPIRVDKVDAPSDEMVNALHSKYVDAVAGIFEQYKDQYNYADTRLVIM